MMADDFHSALTKAFKDTPMKGEITHMEVDPASMILGTGFKRYASRSGIFGLCKIEDDKICLLVVESHDPGKGQFRNFITALKKEYAVIRVLEVWNQQLGAALGRYGFNYFTFRQPWGEKVEGVEWRSNGHLE